MQLSLLSEAKQLTSSELAEKLSKYRPFATAYTISAIVPNNQLGVVKAIVKHAKWQIHSQSEHADRIYLDITPLKMPKYVGDISTLYHITDRSNLSSIMSKGLQLSSNTPQLNFPRRVYLYPTIKMAIERADMARQLGHFAKKTNDDPVVLKIDNSTRRYTAFIDPENYLGMGQDDTENVPIYTSKSIRPADITEA